MSRDNRRKAPALTRSASASSTRDPDPPKDPAHPPLALPETISASRKLLFDHKFINKQNEEVSIYTLISILFRVVRLPGVASHPMSIIKSVTHLLPEVHLKAQAVSDKSTDILAKLEEMSKQIKTLGSLDEKLAPLCDSLSGVQESVARAESSAANAEKSMQALHESLAWKSTPAPDTPPATTLPAKPNMDGFSNSGMHPDRQARLLGRSVSFASAASQPPSRPPPMPKHTTELSDQSLALTCRVLVQPKGDAAQEALSKLTSRELVAKAEFAAEAAWKELKATDFARKAGRLSKPTLDFKTAIRLPRGGIEYAMETAEQASWLSMGPVAKAFERGFGSNIECKGQHATVKIEWVTTTFKVDQEDATGTVECKNGLDTGDILSVSWFKPLARRASGQPYAVLKAELRSMDVADRLISKGSRIEFAPVQIRRLEEDPIQCLKCQKYGHLVAKCKEPGNTCSHCGGGHRFSNCNKKELKHCVSCGTDAHCLWDRQCPAFQVAHDRLNERKPDNRRRFFNPTLPAAPIDEPAPFFGFRGPFQGYGDDELLTPRAYGSSNQLCQTTIYDRPRPRITIRGDLPSRPTDFTWGNGSASEADWDTSEPLVGPIAQVEAVAESPSFLLTRVRRCSDLSLSDTTTATVRVMTPTRI